MKISLDLMREYIHLASTRSYSKTSEELFMAQSALSRHISALEAELGTQLIIRGKSTFQLTPAGEAVRDHFEKILAEYQALLFDIAPADAECEGRLDVGILYYDMQVYGGRVREAFKSRYPKVELVFHSAQAAELESGLLEGALDVAILYGLEECANPAVQHRVFLEIPYGITVALSHPLASLEHLHLSDLEGSHAIVPTKPLGLNRVDVLSQRMLQEAGVSMTFDVPLANFDELPYVLEETGAVYFAPMANVNAYGPEFPHRHFEDETSLADVSAVWLSSNANPAIRHFCDALAIMA